MDKIRPFISVVMPVYKVEKHLQNAVESILQQSFCDYEIILVDDCSPDCCPEICDRYAQNYKNITAIHHDRNQGLSQARNTGMDIAKGRYIWFMDSDDFVDNDLFEKVYQSVQYNKAQVIVFGLKEEYYDNIGNIHHTHLVRIKECYLNNQTEVREMIIDLEKRTLYGYAWNKFYDLDYLRSTGIKYEKVTLIEDILFNVNFFTDVSSMNILDITSYHYNKRMDNSLTSRFVPDYYDLHRTRIKIIYDQYVNWNMCSEKVRGILGVLYTRYIFSALQRNCDKRAHMSFGQRRKWLSLVFQDDLFKKIIPYTNAESQMLRIMSNLLKKNRMLSCLVI